MIILGNLCDPLKKVSSNNVIFVQNEFTIISFREFLASDMPKYTGLICININIVLLCFMCQGFVKTLRWK